MTEDSALPSHYRRWLRVSLRASMVLVLVIGCGLGWVIHRARIQREAVAAIERAGGTVLYHWQWANHDLIPSARPPGSSWLRAVVGPEYLDDVAFVTLSGSIVTDEILPHVGQLRQLDGLWLQATAVGDSGMRHLAGLSRLSELCLSQTRVSDAGIKHLGELRRLIYLEVIDTRVTSDGLNAFQEKLPRVEIFGPEH